MHSGAIRPDTKLFMNSLSSTVSPGQNEVMASVLQQTIQMSAQKPGALVIPYLPYFIGSIVKGSMISNAVFFSAMIYIKRLKRKLPSTALGMACTGHRIGLAAIILAEKVICDVPMKNTAWAHHAAVFSLQEINLMERQLLELLDYRLDIKPSEIFNAIIASQSPDIRNAMLFPPLSPLPRAFMARLSRHHDRIAVPLWKKDEAGSKNDRNIPYNVLQHLNDARGE